MVELIHFVAGVLCTLLVLVLVVLVILNNNKSRQIAQHENTIAKQEHRIKFLEADIYARDNQVRIIRMMPPEAARDGYGIQRAGDDKYLSYEDDVWLEDLDDGAVARFISADEAYTYAKDTLKVNVIA